MECVGCPSPNNRAFWACLPTCTFFKCLLQSAGNIVSIRLVLDFDTGKPKGDHFLGRRVRGTAMGTGYTQLCLQPTIQCLALVAASPHIVADEHAHSYIRFKFRQCVFLRRVVLSLLLLRDVGEIARSMLKFLVLLSCTTAVGPPIVRTTKEITRKQ